MASPTLQTSPRGLPPPQPPGSAHAHHRLPPMPLVFRPPPPPQPIPGSGTPGTSAVSVPMHSSSAGMLIGLGPGFSSSIPGGPQQPSSARTPSISGTVQQSQVITDAVPVARVMAGGMPTGANFSLSMPGTTQQPMVIQGNMSGAPPFASGTLIPVFLGGVQPHSLAAVPPTIIPQSVHTSSMIPAVISPSTPPSLAGASMSGPPVQAVAVQMPGTAPGGMMGTPGRPGLIATPPTTSSQFMVVRSFPPHPGYSINSMPQPQMIPPGVLGSAPAGMAPRHSSPLFSPMVRPMSFPPRSSVVSSLSTISTMSLPRPLGPTLRPISVVLKYPLGSGVPVPELAAKGVGQIGAAEKPQTTVYVGKISSTVEDEFLRSMLELCGQIKSWKRAHDPTTGAAKGFGFCEFESADGVLRALRLLNKFSLEGQDLVLNVNQATREYLERYLQKKVEHEKQLKEESDREEESAPGVDIIELKKPAAEIPKGKSFKSECGTEDSGKKFGIVDEADREADERAFKKLSSMLEERARLKPLPPPPALPSVSDAPVNSNSISEAPAKLKDGDSVLDVAKDGLDGRNEEETTSENRPGSEYERPEASSSDRGRRFDRFRERDREREMKREKDWELEKYERERERERLRREREREMRIRDAERLYEEREKQWEERERERERIRQMDREREKERERDRRKEIKDQEEESDEGWRKRRHRDMYEERRKRRHRETVEDGADRIKEEQEIAESKRQKVKEANVEENNRKQELSQQMESCGLTTVVDDQVEGATTEIQAAKYVVAMISESNMEDELPQAEGISINGTCMMVGDEGLVAATLTSGVDGTQSSLAPRKLGFGLVGSGKRAAVPSVFYEEDEKESPTDCKLRPLVPIDYSAEEMQAVSSTKPTSSGNAPNLVAAAKFAKSLSNLASNSKEERREEHERERERKHRAGDKDRGYREREDDRMREKEKDRGREDRVLERGREKYRSSEMDYERELRSKELENRKLLDAKELIDQIPKTKEELFGYIIDWDIYDEQNLHERMRPWISKKITSFLGEEETTLVDFIVNNTRKHVTAAHMLELMEPILDDEAEMFVLKMWRMLIFEIRKVETGIASKPKA